MGLTIHYQFHSVVHRAGEARELVNRLRQHALDLPFQSVGEMIDLSPPACNYRQRERDDPNRWLLIQATQLIERDQYMYNVPPKRLIAFSTQPAEGSEPANFGLCLYPNMVVAHDGKKVGTGLPHGWLWNSFCKTQYASNPKLGGVENFLRCHLSLIRLLDHARELGMLKHVSDEGGYWEKRDVQALVQEVGEWNEAIAGFAGQLKDQLTGQGMEAAITRFSDFEHLEAKGRAGEVA